MAQLDEDGGSRIGVPVAVMVAVAAVTMLGGAAVGVGSVLALRPAEVRTEVVARDLTAHELDAACQPLVTEVTAAVDAANSQIADLVSNVNAKSDKVRELEAEMKRRGAAGAKLKQELKVAKAELAEVKQQLAVALGEKDALVAELKTAVADRDAQKMKTFAAKQMAFDYGWQAFVSSAQLDVCERGSRKKLGKCRETLVSALAPLHDDYQRCLRTGQAMPSLQEAEKKQEEIPQFARWLDQDNRVLAGWYIQLCDPTLPEAKEYAEIARAPDAAAAEPWRALDVP